MKPVRARTLAHAYLHTLHARNYRNMLEYAYIDTHTKEWVLKMSAWWLHASIAAQVFSDLPSPPPSLLLRALSIYQIGLGKCTTALLLVAVHVRVPIQI